MTLREIASSRRHRLTAMYLLALAFDVTCCLYIMFPHPFYLFMFGVALVLSSQVFVFCSTVALLAVVVALALFPAAIPVDTARISQVFLVCTTSIAALLGSNGILVCRGPKNDALSLSRSLSLVVRMVSLTLCVASLLMASSRRFPAVESLSLGILFFLLFRGWSERREQGYRSWRTTIASAGAVFASTVLSLLMLEAGVRLLLPYDQAPSPIYWPHPQYIFALRPGGHCDWTFRVSKTQQKRMPIAISPQGFRDRVYGPKEPGEYRILMLGDSHTMGHVVAPEDTIPKQLERFLRQERPKRRVTVINAGFSAAPAKCLRLGRQVKPILLFAQDGG